jgi:hypothetical protein
MAWARYAANCTQEADHKLEVASISVLERSSFCILLFSRVLCKIGNSIVYAFEVGGEISDGFFTSVRPMLGSVRDAPATAASIRQPRLLYPPHDSAAIFLLVPLLDLDHKNGLRSYAARYSRSNIRAR